MMVISRLEIDNQRGVSIAYASALDVFSRGSLF